MRKEGFALGRRGESEEKVLMDSEEKRRFC